MLVLTFFLLVIVIIMNVSLLEVIKPKLDEFELPISEIGRRLVYYLLICIVPIQRRRRRVRLYAFVRC